jgi:hypothetical protein
MGKYIRTDKYFDKLSLNKGKRRLFNPHPPTLTPTHTPSYVIYNYYFKCTAKIYSLIRRASLGFLLPYPLFPDGQGYAVLMKNEELKKSIFSY